MKIFNNKSGEIAAFKITDNVTELQAFSPLNGVHHVLQVPVDIKAVEEYFEGSISIQDAFPTLTLSQREFIMTSIPDEDWPG